MDSITPEFRIFLASAAAFPTRDNEGVIWNLRIDGIDWSIFAQIAIDRGLASLIGNTLVRVAPDIVRDDNLNAFSVIVNRARQKSDALLYALRCDAWNRLRHTPWRIMSIGMRD
jgi:hypothetical protein